MIYDKLFKMLNNKNDFQEKLGALGLSEDEARIYVELLKDSQTYLALSRHTGINRTTIYRIVDELIKKSLVSKETTERGNYLIAKDPQTFGVVLADEEVELKKKREVYKSVLPDLESLIGIGDSDSFKVLTYDGVEGLKQMLWHELKTKGDLLVICDGAMEELVGKGKWAEKHRERTVRAGYRVRDLFNYEPKRHKKESPTSFTEVAGFADLYSSRYIDPKILNITDNQIAIYNDTVSIYLSKGKRKVGVEIINKPYTDLMRQMFEGYWKMAKAL